MDTPLTALSLADLPSLSLEALVMRNQILGAQQDAIRAERKAIADEIRARVARGARPPAAPGDGAASGALPTVALAAAG